MLGPTSRIAAYMSRGIHAEQRRDLVVREVRPDARPGELLHLIDGEIHEGAERVVDEGVLESDLLHLFGHCPELGVRAVRKGEGHAAIRDEMDDVAHLGQQASMLVEHGVADLPRFSSGIGPWLPTPTFVSVLMAFATGIQTASTPSSSCFRMASTEIGSLPRATLVPTQVLTGAISSASHQRLRSS